MDTTVRTGRQGFHVGDAMILIVALAGGLSLCRTFLGGYLPRPSRPWLGLGDVALSDWIAYVVVYLFTGTIACMVVRLRHGRPASGHVFDTPGMAAVTAASFVFVLESATMLMMSVVGTRHDFIGPPTWLRHTSDPGSAVAGVWAVSLVSGRWEWERTWVDRLGLGLGIGWVGIALVCWGGSITPC